VAADGASLAAVVVMLMTPPRSPREWAVGLIFACGLPGWAVVRWVVNFIDRNQNVAIDDIARNVKDIL